MDIFGFHENDALDFEYFLDIKPVQMPHNIHKYLDTVEANLFMKQAVICVR